VRVAILTISDAGARGERVDTSGDAAERWALARGDSIAARNACP
jgi:molybdopterin biosynthesis enzyme MoaB